MLLDTFFARGRQKITRSDTNYGLCQSGQVENSASFSSTLPGSNVYQTFALYRELLSQEHFSMHFLQEAGKKLLEVTLLIT